MGTLVVALFGRSDPAEWGRGDDGTGRFTGAWSIVALASIRTVSEERRIPRALVWTGWPRLCTASSHVPLPAFRIGIEIGVPITEVLSRVSKESLSY